MKTLQVKFQKYRKNKANEIADLKTKRKTEIVETEPKTYLRCFKQKSC